MKTSFVLHQSEIDIANVICARLKIYISGNGPTPIFCSLSWRIVNVFYKVSKTPSFEIKMSFLNITPTARNLFASFRGKEGFSGQTFNQEWMWDMRIVKMCTNVCNENYKHKFRLSPHFNPVSFANCHRKTYISVEYFVRFCCLWIVGHCPHCSFPKRDFYFSISLSVLIFCSIYLPLQLKIRKYMKKNKQTLYLCYAKEAGPEMVKLYQKWTLYNLIIFSLDTSIQFYFCYLDETNGKRTKPLKN